ncbi:hypothetical protein [Bradyrhizobium yuanmingense]|uniref:hypothetical protein n=1 Tax=Bradyrhizobium yuanmingense TaxID=108015 RepID=UPI0023B9B058|nr:hypothetical protein [Bradyrhizobium yuanmingense]MDF0499020.1 hypothetical protein [Bradyrhizobium yuanmingense]
MRTTKLSFKRHGTQTMQATTATRAKAKLDQAGQFSICRLCETLSVALRFSNINMEGMYQRRPSAHSSLCATGAAAARLQLRA